MMRLLRAASLVLSMVLAPAAWSQAPSGASPMTGMDRASTSQADKAMMAGMETMRHGMADAPMTGDPDQDFVAMMKPHHAGAIDMAKVELQYGTDPALRAMARDIISAQEKEIAEMAAWQAAHPKP